MTNATLEKSGSERGDNESEQQEEKGYLAVQEGDSPAGSPRKSSSSYLESYGSDEDDSDNGAPLVSKVLSDDVPSGGGNGNCSHEGNKKEVSGSSFREHDYIGLSDGGSGGSTCTTQEEKTKGRELDFGPKTRETELRLGPPQEPSFQNNSLQRNNTNPGVLVHQGPAKPEGGIINSAAILPVDSEGRAGKPYALNDSHLQRWNRPCFSEQPHLVSGKFVYPKQTPIKDSSEPKFFNNGHEVHPQLQDYNNGMTFLLTPKSSTATLTAGAKRVFSDAMGGAQVVRGAFNMSNDASRMSLDSMVSGQPQPQPQSQPQPQPHPSMGLMYPWTNAVQLANTWQVNIEQQQQHRGNFGPFPPPTARVMVGNIMAAAAVGNIPMKESPHGTSSVKPSQESISAAMRPPMAPSPPSDQQQKNLTLSPSNEIGNSRAAPVVGWPPIRSFRKNLAPQPKPDTEGRAIASDNSFVSADRGQAFGDSMFVKVNMDGVPIGRKIDLNAYDSYQKLSEALEEMFKRFVKAQASMQRPNPNSSSENDQPLLCGRDYVLTYEDNEGDRMLVGDVPWEMFVSTVKRLRIMKSSEARGLGVPRQPPKPQGQLTQ